MSQAVTAASRLDDDDMTMDNWTMMTPYACLSFQGNRDFEAKLNCIPGLKFKKGAWNVPVNAIELVDNLRIAHDVELLSAAWGRKPVRPKSWDEIEVELKASGEVRDWVFDFLVQHQKDVVAFGWHKVGVHCWHATGAGKSLSSYILALSAPGPVILVTRASARLQHGREIERFLNVRSHVVRAESSIRKLMTVNGKTWHEFFAVKMAELGKASEVSKLWREAKNTSGVISERQVESLSDYVARCKEESTRPFIVVGWEMLKDYYLELAALRPSAVIYDELHWRGRNPKRWDVVSLPDLPDDEDEALAQRTSWEEDARSKGGFVKVTEDGWRMFLPVLNIAAAAARLARLVPKRIGTTATPVSNLVRDLWSQLDIVEPNCWSNKTAWLAHHAASKRGTYGGFDTSGYSNLEELKCRLDHVAHIVPYKDTHRNLPPKRRQSLYISPEDQCKESTGFRDELKQAKQRGATSVLEVRLALAASKKRKAVLGAIGDHVQSGQKVVVFTARKRDCDELGCEVRKYLKSIGFTATVWDAHGSTSTEDRQAIVDEYMAHLGPCVLIGTGHSFGESLNLQDTDAAFFVMLPYTPGMLRQWEGRFARLGQKRPVILYYVIAEGTVDEHIASILINKLPAVEQVTQDTELAEAKAALAGLGSETDDEFIDSILASLDL